MEPVRCLDDAQLQQLLQDLPRRPMLAGLDGLRLSLEVAQDKMPMVFDGQRLGLPLHGAPSTPILKPAIRSLERSVYNEAFCMLLAAALKLPVAAVKVQTADGQPFLLVQRYDRLPVAHVGAPLQRLHQEDICQALGVVHEHKHQNEGGPSLAQTFELLRQTTWPSAPHLLRLLDAVVLNALMGKHDADSKNFLLLYGADTGRSQAFGRSASLAPLYDLLSTAVYPQLTDKLAMKIGSSYRFTELAACHWEQFAQEAGLSPGQVRKRVLALPNACPPWPRPR